VGFVCKRGGNGNGMLNLHRGGKSIRFDIQRQGNRLEIIK
jgi:hypothetical protein